jgi:UDP-glucose 4-epimerase
MKIGISGGAGFIGSNLAERLLGSNHEVFIFDNLQTGNLKNLDGLNSTLCSGDLRDRDAVDSFFKVTEIEYLVHLGALGSVPRSISDPRSSFDSNAVATLNVLEAVKLNHVPILFTSSSSVYGKNTALPKRERDWLSPISPYAAAKLAAENLMLAYRESFDIQTIVFRLFNVYGRRQGIDSEYAAVIPKWIMAAFKHEPLIVYGDGEQMRDFTYVDDVTKVLQDAIELHYDKDYPVNLAFGQPVRLIELLEVFKEYFGHLNIVFRETRRGDIKNSEANPSQLSELLKREFVVTPIRTGLIETFEWYKKTYGF